MLFYFLIIVTLAGVITAITRIVITHYHGNEAEEQWEEFNRKHPVKHKSKSKNKKE